MSNIGNKIRAGFFATPTRQGNYLKQLLHFSGECSIFDPTCGEGEILKQLGENSEYTVKTYGVELDKRRAAKAEELIDYCTQAPIESMVISNDAFSMVYCNPPYDFAMKGYDDDEADRKEYLELVRNTKYLAPEGILVYVIPSYRFADKKISRFLSTHFDKAGILRFTDEDYEDFKQCLFIGIKKKEKFKEYNQKVNSFLQNMESEEFVLKSVTPLDVAIGKRTWTIPSGPTEIRTFYSKIENKVNFVEAIKNNKGFQAFKERTKPKKLEIGGNPIINIAQGQMALLLASGAVNGLIGTGDKLHAVQGLEIVKKVKTEDTQYHESGSTTKMTKIRTVREVSVKAITPSGLIKKFV
ncbi:DUF6094 domain-containing protein (plasmid) [Sutcliffiella horikoshii]|uniref:DUF6094 domain-containing protein n=1 Tax=Sutcliffiella horikoshii TaxID=79883 RepID=UPI001CBE1DDA|nr:DUF6094 domain-containing protein [Sutcliffiella horikoshii]UAL49871.1 DUF6094 domain-containing protein [Sutcliffiella horikoshii]